MFYHTDWELESIKSLFNEKEKELAMAVAKVEEMTRQLEDIRSGKVKSATNNQSPAAMAELEKLKKELVVSTQRQTLLFCPESVICFLRLLCLFKCIPECFCH